MSLNVARFPTTKSARRVACLRSLPCGAIGARMPAKHIMACFGSRGMLGFPSRVFFSPVPSGHGSGPRPKRSVEHVWLFGGLRHTVPQYGALPTRLLMPCAVFQMFVLTVWHWELFMLPLFLLLLVGWNYVQITLGRISTNQDLVSVVIHRTPFFPPYTRPPYITYILYECHGHTANSTCLPSMCISGIQYTRHTRLRHTAWPSRQYRINMFYFFTS